MFQKCCRQCQNGRIFFDFIFAPGAYADTTQLLAIIVQFDTYNGGEGIGGRLFYDIVDPMTAVQVIKSRSKWWVPITTLIVDNKTQERVISPLTLASAWTP